MGCLGITFIDLMQFEAISLKQQNFVYEKMLLDCFCAFVMENWNDLKSAFLSDENFSRS